MGFRMFGCIVCSREIRHDYSSIRVCSPACGKIVQIKKELRIQKVLQTQHKKKVSKENKRIKARLSKKRRKRRRREDAERNASIILTNAVKTNFYESREWREVRYMAIKRNGRACLACGQTRKKLHVDHIKPRSKYPHLALDLNNLQVLCEDCNLGKSNKDETDWRVTK